MVREGGGGSASVPCADSERVRNGCRFRQGSGAAASAEKETAVQPTPGLHGPGGAGGAVVQDGRGQHR